MGRYEPSWSAEEQTMIDLMGMTGCGIEVISNKHYTDIIVVPAGHRFRADTAYEAIRKAFTYWNKHND
jgi:hypothetical protein